MCSLCTGERSSWRELNWWRHFSQSDIDPLGTEELHQLPPMRASQPLLKIRLPQNVASPT
jgi:hypothetical protein